MRGQKLFVRPMDAADHTLVCAFLGRVPACALLGKVVGDLVAVLAFDVADDGVRIDEILVVPELRRKRIGRFMLNELAQLAAKMEHPLLVVDDARGADDFLRRTGFEQEGPRWIRRVG